MRFLAKVYNLQHWAQGALQIYIIVDIIIIIKLILIYTIILLCVL